MSVSFAATLRPLSAPNSRLISLPSENVEINPAGDSHNAVTQLVPDLKLVLETLIMVRKHTFFEAKSNK